jgi:hypothetical protein
MGSVSKESKMVGQHTHSELTSNAVRTGEIGTTARMLTVAILGMLLLSGFAATRPAPAFAGQSGTINSNGVEVFSHLNDRSVIDYLQAGDRVDIFWGPEGWMYEIHYSGTVGWVWAEYVDVGGAASSSASSGSSQSSSSSSAARAGAWSWSSWAMVDADSLNVRADASSSAAVLDKFGAGKWIEIIGNDVNGFSPVNYYGQVGWVASKYLSWDGTFQYASVGQSSSQSSAKASSGGERWIQINGGTGEVNLMIGNSVHATYWGSVGYDQSPDGFFSTANGTFYVYAMWEPLGYTKWADAYISHWIGYDSYRSNGFHSYSKDASGNVLPNGAGKTGGCVALPAGAIQAVWDFAYMGMRVEVYR